MQLISLVTDKPFQKWSGLLIITVLLLSCNKSSNLFTIGNDFIESETNVEVIDTFGVELSTVILDSVVTSGSNAMLIGCYTDTLFGKITCNSFFQLGLPASISLDEDAFYDSVSLFIPYSGYYYGDTNQVLHIHVHQLTEDIEVYDDGYLYNNSAFSYSPNILGNIQLLPSPSDDDSVVIIKISDEIGFELFNLFVEKSTIISSEETFLDYFKGLVLLAGESTSQIITGFKSSEGDVKLRLYTHRYEQNIIESYYDFPLINTQNQFNQIKYDFQGSLFQYHTDNESKEIPSTVSGNKSFVQGYKKIMTRIAFPTLPDIMLNEYGKILKAELVFRPEKTSYSVFQLPRYVILYESDHLNRPVNYIYDAEGNIQVASLLIDDMYNEETSYTFDISDYIKNEMSDNYFDTEHALLISIYNETYQLNLDRIVVEAKNPAPKLKVYYLTY
jgi:hypothetical protein